MAGQLKVNHLQLGDSATASENFSLSIPATPDGSVKLARGNVGATTQDILEVDSGGAVSFPGGATFSTRKNLIINGAGFINQRYTTSGGSVDSTEFITDRWTCGFAGGTNARVFSTEGQDYGFGLYAVSACDLGVATNYNMGVVTSFEGFNLTQLVTGATATLSFWARSAVLGIHSVGLVAYSDVGVESGRYVAEFTIDAVDTFEYFEIPIVFPAGKVGYTGNDLALQIRIGAVSGTSYHGTVGAWTVGSSFSSVNSVNWTATAANQFKVKEVQLELGSVATPFEHRSYGEELALCQRYYISDQSVRAWQWGAAVTSGDIAVFTVHLPTSMRGTPTVVASTSSSVGLSIGSTIMGSVNSFVLSIDATSTASNAFIRGTYTADAEL